MTCWAFLFTAVWSVFFCTRAFLFRFTVRVAAWKTFLREVLPLAPIAVVSMANMQINMLMLSKVPGPMPATLAMGLFQPAMTITNAPIRIFMRARTVFIAWASSRLSSNLSVKNEYALIMQFVMVLFSAPLILSLTSFSEEIIVLLFGHKFIGGAPSLALLGWGAGLNLLIIVMEGFLLATDHVKRFIRLYLAVFFINCLLCLALIPSYGVYGAAVALLATRIMQFAAMTLFCNAHIPEISFGLRQAAVPVMALLTMLACTEGLALIPMNWLVKLLACSLSWGVVVGFAALLLIRGYPLSPCAANPSVQSKRGRS
jgi:O-antigen/teichoic acid export membrane protein